MDNTLINLEKQLLEGCEEWCNNLKQQGIKMCILSNTNKVHKVKLENGYYLFKLEQLLTDKNISINKIMKDTNTDYKVIKRAIIEE